MAAAANLIPDRSEASIHGSAFSPTRVLLVGYGQSNMDSFFSSTSGSPPTPNANVSFYNGTSILNPLAPGAKGDGIIVCMNQINNVTGLPVLSLTGAVGGNPISLLTPGNSAFTSLIAQVNAVIQPTDYVVMIWDQGEGDAAFVPPEQPQDYIGNLKLIRDGLASSLGLPNIALLCAGLGTGSGTGANQLLGQPSGGNSQYTWQRIRNAHFFSGVQIPHVYFSHTNIDITRSDEYHYIAPTIDGMGQRFAQNVTTLMGKTSGFAHWEIASAVTVDATHTNVNLTQSLGTDFTPTSGADGWQVSGDNGANWVTATGARNSGTQLQLTHSSVSTTSARIVRYQWGYNQNSGALTSTPGLLRDNSALTVPLTPTTWDIRPTAISSVPCATWRNSDTLTGTFSAWTSRKLLCWPSADSYQKLIIIAVYSGGAIDPVGNPLTLVVHPDAGSPVTATFIAKHPSTNSGGGLALYQALLGTDADAAQYLMVTGSQSSNPFTNYVFHIYDVNAAYLSSTTNTGTNNATTTLATNTTPPLTANCTVNVSAGGLMIAMNAISVLQNTQGAFATYSSNFNNRWEDGTTITLDAANSAANASSPFSVSFGTTDPSNPINMYTLMASWR